MKCAPEKPRIELLGSNGFLGGLLYSNLVHQGYLVMRAECNLTYFESFHSGLMLDRRKSIAISMAWSSNCRNDYINNSENLIWAKKNIEIAKYCLGNDCVFDVPRSCPECGKNQAKKYVNSKIQLIVTVEI